MSRIPVAKKIAAMQPYLFPYLGYFQLIAATDEFVLGDDLQYAKQSWINRNRVLLYGREKLITFQVKKGSHLARINEKVFADDFPAEMDQLLKKLRHSYGKAPCFEQVFPMLEEILRNEETNLAKYAEYSIRRICDYLDIGTSIRVSSDLGLGMFSDKQDRVISTVRALDGCVYINPISGMHLYDPHYFAQFGIELCFHRMDDVAYRQFGNAFIPSLSIIDVLMFNTKAELDEKLQMYSLERLGLSIPGFMPESITHASAH
jgi:hypothetical protein